MPSHEGEEQLPVGPSYPFGNDFKTWTPRVEQEQQRCKLGQFLAFLAKALAVAQNHQGSSNADALKDQLLMAEDSLNLALQDKMKLVEDNKNLKDRVLVLTTKAKGLETRVVNAKALVRSQDAEVTRLRLALVATNMKTEEATADKE